MENKDDLLFDLSKFVNGCLESPIDERDYKISLTSHPDINTVSSRPINFSQPDPQIVHNQGGTGKCVGYSNKCGLEFFNRLQYGKFIEMSVDFIYSNRLEGELNYDLIEGMYPRETLSHLLKDGCCEEQYFPIKRVCDIKSNPDGWNKWDDKLITPIMRESAKNYKIGSYFSLDYESEIKDALMKNMYVLFSIPITEQFIGGYNKTIGQYELNTCQKFYGRHCVRCLGWEEYNGIQYWICQNSWGRGWGDNGKFRIPFDTIIYEKWSVSDLPLEKIHWALPIFNYLDSININIPERDYETKCTRSRAFKMLAYGLGCGNKPNEHDDYYYNYCNNNGVKILEKRYDSPITRGETMTLFAKMLGWKESDKSNSPKGSHWAETFFIYLRQHGIPLTDKRYNDTIKVAEFATFIAKLKGFK